MTAYDRQDQKVAHLMRMASRASVTVAFMLLSGKLVVWWLSDSLAMLGSAADSGLDLIASLVTLFAIRAALMPPDADHRFGHGKAEALAGLFQSALMAGSALFLILEAIRHLDSAGEVVKADTSDMIIAVSAFAIVLSLALVSFQAYVVRRTGSIAIAGDHLHYKGDLLLNLAVIVSAFGVQAGYSIIDPIAGLLIGLYILFGAVGIARPAIDMLMDREMDDEKREQIFNLVLENKGVLGLHALKTRLSGRDVFIQMHIDVDGRLKLAEANVIAREVEATLSEHFPGADVLIHMDPARERSARLTYREIPKETKTS